MPLRPAYPLYLANRPRDAAQTGFDLAVTNKYTGAVATRVARADAKLLDEAIAAAAGAAEPMRRMRAYQRQAVLRHLVEQCEKRVEELAHALCIEAGKPITYSRLEVTRLIDTLRIGMEEATRIAGEIMPLDITERAANYTGMWKRVPIGPCALITPWNFPLNLVAHKIAPALAVGCPFIAKPASYTPVGALLLGEMLAETDLPEGAFSILPMNSKDAGALTEDDRLRKLSFTGSAEVGWALKAKSGRKKITLELGGNAAVIVDHDANLDDAVARIVFGAFYQSGQSCISVQRIYAHRGVYNPLRDKLVAATKALKHGDPLEEDTFIGPMVTEDDAKRVEQWVNEALSESPSPPGRGIRGEGERAKASEDSSRSPKLLCGGKREGSIYHATLLENAPRDAKVCHEEVFGPVAVLEQFDDFDEVIGQVNDSRYGLQAGVFTRDIERVLKAWDEIEVGGVIINDVPSFRVDNMPYGGVKDSGLGREGIKFAMADMTEIRLLAIRRVD